ncbi:CoA pyrophosphatase [Clostridium sp. JN-9]|uniref:NUDIX hydrolase n=1 Tax=Clostridium sp. JN-9 TaxID=2507159 RepID=UPI000FFE200B|nr:CoA pyrophosphatase [Clostridium sp. JN-9]QAT40318.1 CoA pyrophosphatase [Clostridium sp. JN-9]
MNENEIKEIFKNRSAGIIGNHKKSSVMILMTEENNNIFVLFEERSHKLRHQPGDICLPGGRIEKNETPVDAAVREVCEELKLSKQDIKIIGEMDYFVSPYNTIMYPFIASTKGCINASEDEVERIIKIPLNFFINNEPILYDLKIGPLLEDDFPYDLINNGRDYKFSRGILKEYFYKYKDIVIWGFTAQIIKSFVDILKANL